MKWLAVLLLTPAVMFGGFIMFVAAIVGGTSTSTPAAAADGHVSKSAFAGAVLAELDAPVTAQNVAKLVVWFQHESGGGGGTWNPLDYVVAAPGSTDFNSAHVQNYPDVPTGVAMTARLLQQANTQSITLNLLADGPWGDYLAAVAYFNEGWTSPGWRAGMMAATTDEARKYWDTPINGTVASVTPVTAGAPDGIKIVLAAMQFLGVPYVNQGEQGRQAGHPPDAWLAAYQAGQPVGLECSGLVDVALLVAFNVNINLCSAEFLTDPRFARIPWSSVQPGDEVVEGTTCGPTGHVAIVVSFDPATGEGVIIDANHHGDVVGFRHPFQLARLFDAGPVRYVG